DEFDYNVLEEFLCLGSCDLGDRFGFNPLGELVDGDEEVCVTTQRSLQGPTMSRSQTAKGQVIGIVCSSCAGMCIYRAKYWHPSHLWTSSSASVTAVSQKKPCR